MGWFSKQPKSTNTDDLCLYDMNDSPIGDPVPPPAPKSARIIALEKEFAQDMEMREKLLTQAREEIELTARINNVQLSKEEFDKLFQLRFSELMTAFFDQREAQKAQKRANIQARQQHEELTARLEELSTAIERGNIGAKAVDFVQDHPFLTGVFGRLIYDKLTDSLKK